MTPSGTGNPVLDMGLLVVMSVLGTGVATEIVKAIISSITGRGKEKRQLKKDLAVAEEIERRSLHYWREMTYETRAVALEWGIPREELPEIRKSLEAPDDL